MRCFSDFLVVFLAICDHGSECFFLTHTYTFLQSGCIGLNLSGYELLQEFEVLFQRLYSLLIYSFPMEKLL